MAPTIVCKTSVSQPCRCYFIALFYESFCHPHIVLFTTEYMTECKVFRVVTDLLEKGVDPYVLVRTLKDHLSPTVTDGRFHKTTTNQDERFA